MDYKPFEMILNQLKEFLFRPDQIKYFSFLILLFFLNHVNCISCAVKKFANDIGISLTVESQACKAN